MANLTARAERAARRRGIVLLEAVEGILRGARYEIELNVSPSAVSLSSVVLGREEGELQLSDETIPSTHATIRVQAAGSSIAQKRYTIEDLGSLNGTRVNGTRLTVGERKDQPPLDDSPLAEAPGGLP